jgi:tRNA pseudouridine13 synthase
VKDCEESTKLPYVSESLRGIGGTLRLRPEHFRVEEIPLYEASGEGEHLYVSITKAGRTSKSVQADLARLFGMKPTNVGMAGLKDKNACTTQTFSVHVGIQGAEYAQEAADRITNELGLQVNWARFHRNKLKTGHLLGNRFAILVGKPECDRQACLDRCSLISDLMAERGLPNFFGPQRFGSGGGNVSQGLSILRGTTRRRNKWLQKFLVGSVQSHLCNVYLAERLHAGLFDRLLPGDVAKKYDTGGMFDVEDIAVEQGRYDAHEISFTAPIFGPKMWAAKGESGELEAAILSNESLTVEDFGKVRVNGTRRLGRLLIDDLTVEAMEDGMLFRFSLPKGAYATTVMREFMKNDGEAAFAVDDDVYGETQQ